jgi:hypothetical protein
MLAKLSLGRGHAGRLFRLGASRPRISPMNFWIGSAYSICYAAWLFLLTGMSPAQTRLGVLPRFEDYPAKPFTGSPAVPKLVTPLQQSYADQIKEGVENGYGVFRGGKEEKGPNFAGEYVLIQWACGAPCMRMAIVAARTGDVYFPPISFEGVGAPSFDLPLLTFENSVPQNPAVQFQLNSRLLIIKATLNQIGGHPPYTYYFLWGQNGWTLLRRVPLNSHTGDQQTGRTGYP